MPLVYLECSFYKNFIVNLSFKEGETALFLESADDSALHVPPLGETLDIPRLEAVMRALGDLEDVNDKLKRENDSRLARIRAEWEVVITTQLELTARGERIRERRQEIIENAMREDE